MSKFLLVIALIFSGEFVFAQHKGINFQAVIKRPNGSYPTASGLTVTVQILDPVTNCVLREEEHASINVSNGYINLLIGSSLATTPPGRNPTPVLSIVQAMDNATARSNLNCVDINNNVVAISQAYTPSNSHTRKLRLRLNILGDQVVADFNMRAVAFAVNSEMLNNKTDEDFINVKSGDNLTQANVESIFQRFTKLDNILNNFNAAGTALSANITGSAATATTAGNVTGVVALANGGTGATTATAARTNLGLGDLATWSPSGTADNTTYLRGDGSWAPMAVGSGTITEVTAGTGLSGGGTSGAVTLNLTDVGTAGSYTKVTTDAQGRVTSGTTLSAADIPALDASKITTGTFADSMLAGLSVDKLISATAKYFNYKPNGISCANDEVLKYDSTLGADGGWKCAADSGVGAETDPTVQAFAKTTPGAGLEINGSNQLQVTFGTAAGTVAEGNDSRITGAFQTSTSLSGDLSGTLPSPTVARINGVAAAAAVAGDDQKFYKYVHGSGWQPHFVKLSELRNNAGTGSAFDVASCTSGQTLAWSSLTDQFACQNISLAAGNLTGLATVATSGDYADLINKPTIPAAQVNSDWNAVSGVAQILNKPTLGTLSSLSPTGTADNTTFLRGDGAWTAVNSGVSSVAGKTGAVTLEAADITDFNIAADARITLQKGAANGLATLNASGKVPSTQLDLTSSDIPALDASKITSGSFADAMLAGLSIDKLINGAGKYFNYMPNGSACSDNQVLKYDSTLNAGAGGWKCASDSGIGTETDPTVQAFAKNAPSTGLTVNGSNQLIVNFGTTAGTVMQGNDTRITGAFQAATTLGGDLSGTLPNPTVERIKGQAVTATATSAGQVLRYNGTGWTPNFVSMFDLRSTVTGTQAFGGTGCTSSETLTWTAATDNLSCTAIAIASSQVSGLAASATTDTTNASNISSGTLDVARFPASVTDALWTISGSDLYKTLTGNVGIGNTSPKAKLDVSGEIKMGESALACSADSEGAQRYNSATKVMQFCDGTTWQNFTSSGGGGLRNCDTGNPNDVMVQVGSWCVDKYEASLWATSDGSGAQLFNEADIADGLVYPGTSYLPASFNRNGSGSTIVYALSKPNVIPARGITWYQAVVACANSGKVLIPDTVWQIAALGTNDPGASSGTGGSAGGSATDHNDARCNINTQGASNDVDGNGKWLDANNKVRPTAKAGATVQGTQACISRYGAEDLIGNLAEWTDLHGTQAGAVISGFTQGQEIGTAGPFTTSDATWNINGSTYACKGETNTPGTCAWQNGTPAAAVRGGSWSDSTKAGITAIDLSNAGSVSSWKIGFRCARQR